MKGDYKVQKTILRNATIFVIGAFAYGLIEICVRGYTHISMGFLGGICMLTISFLNSKRRKGLPLLAILVFMMFFITFAELITGIIVNINMQLNIWDYSDVPLNYKGQICLPFMGFWFVLSFLGIVIDEFLRWKFFKIEMPLLFWSRRKIQG